MGFNSVFKGLKDRHNLLFLGSFCCLIVNRGRDYGAETFRFLTQEGSPCGGPFEWSSSQSLRQIFYENQVNKGSTKDSELCLWLSLWMRQSLLWGIRQITGHTIHRTNENLEESHLERSVLEASLNVMAHAQKPDFVLPAKRTSPFNP